VSLIESMRTYRRERLGCEVVDHDVAVPAHEPAIVAA
jgi:hypothetical protein